MDICPLMQSCIDNWILMADPGGGASDTLHPGGGASDTLDPGGGTGDTLNQGRRG